MKNLTNLRKLIVQQELMLKFNLNTIISRVFMILIFMCSNAETIFSQNAIPVISQKDSAVLVVSGGGARGAWGAGISKALDSLLHVNYKYAVGTSTGALLAPFIVIKEFDLLKEMYTGRGAENGKIIRPRLYNKKGNFTKRSIASVFKKQSISSSQPLLDLLEGENGLTEDKYNRLKDNGIEVEVSAIGLELGNIRFRSSNDCDRSEFIHWMWASSNQPAFMTPYIKREFFRVYSSKDSLTFTRNQIREFETKTIKTTDIGNGVFEHEVSSKINWVDGGAMENIPISQALLADSTASDIFIIVNNKAPQQVYQLPAMTIKRFVENKDNNSNDKEYDIMADSIITWVNSLPKDEQSNVSLNLVYEKMLQIMPQRISSKINLNLFDIERLTDVGTPKAASFDTDAFNIQKANKRQFKTKRVFNKILATIDVFSKETYMNDLLAGMKSNNAIGKTFHVFFMPLEMYELNPSSLYFNKDNMIKLFENGNQFNYFDRSTAKKHSEFFEFTFRADSDQIRSKFLDAVKSLENAVKSKNKAQIILELKKFDLCADPLL